VNSRFMVLAAVCGLIACGQAFATSGGASTREEIGIDFYIAWNIGWMYDQEKLARDVNRQFYDTYGSPVFAANAVSNIRAMASVMAMLDYYELQGAFGELTDRSGFYMDERHAVVYDDLLSRGGTSLREAYSAAAYVEEWNIYEYRANIETITLGQCDPCEGLQPLSDAYVELLAEAYIRFAQLAARVDGYSAQMLSQADVDQIIADIAVPPTDHFTINAGLNDAWYDPTTNGQGFFIAVYEGQGTVFMSWYTFDTEAWTQQATAVLGDSSQRWLTAQGSYAGAEAELVVYSSGGGVFDSSSPAPSMESIGTIRLQFDDCYSGSVSYDLPALGRSGVIPIERLAKDNTAICEVVNPSLQ